LLLNAMLKCLKVASRTSNNGIQIDLIP